MKGLVSKVIYTLRSKAVESSTMSLIDDYLKNGSVPWTPGYSKFKNVLMMKTIQDSALMEAFRTGGALPPGYGARIDERIVECPWAIAKIGDTPGLLLDAGSVLNWPPFLETPQLRDRDIVVYSLEMDQLHLNPRISYVHGDFRQPVLRDGVFSTIACISTLEHVGMWPIPKPPFEENLAKPQPAKDFDGFKVALTVFRNLLAPGGRLLLTVPYGLEEDQDWLYIHGPTRIAAVKEAFGGDVLSESYYRHSADGWQSATAAECSGLKYHNLVKEKTFGSDMAAAARAVACLELVRR